MVWSRFQKKWCWACQRGKARRISGFGKRGLVRNWDCIAWKTGTEEGRKEGVPCSMRRMAMFAEDLRRRNRSAEPRRFRSYTAGSFLALKTLP